MLSTLSMFLGDTELLAAGAAGLVAATRVQAGVRRTVPLPSMRRRTIERARDDHGRRAREREEPPPVDPVARVRLPWHAAASTAVVVTAAVAARAAFLV